MEGLAELLGESAAIQAVRDNIRRLLARPPAGRRLPSILIQGETGTGKGLLARLIQRHGPRADGPFVDVNCAAIPETLLEAELFGFERGAFTDARRSKPGLFQTAHRGTIFLDEVGLLPEALQAKLLKVLEEQAVRRLGSTTSEPVDVWVISATNADLQAAIAARRFREDLYHRLAVLTLQLPPLRERGRDVVLLAERFLARACADYGLPPKTLSPEAQARLLAYPWPGNVRELGNMIERVALLAEGSVVNADTLELPFGTAARSGVPASAPPAASLEDAMRDHLLAALTQTGWNISRAAALLGISRNTLRARIEKFGLRIGAVPAAPARRPVRAPARLPVPAESQPPAPAIVPPGPVPAPSAIRWETRRVTLLRATLITPESDEELPDTSRALDVLLDKLRAFGGRIEELSPRGVGAVFGLEPVEDAPRRAAHAAMAIQKAAERGRRGDGEPFSAQIGIHVGKVLVGQSSAGTEIDADAKRAHWTVLDALLASTSPGSILLSAAAVPFLERRFDLAAESGTAGRVYRLQGRERKGLALEGEMAWFVGRRQELDLLKSRLASARVGRGQIVGIVGEAGIGKSRLLHEFRQALRGEAITYVEGHCLSYGTAIPYLPALEILRHACRITAVDAPETVTHKLRTNLQHLGIEPEDALPYLLQFLGIKDGADVLASVPPETIQARTSQILRQMCVNASRRRPLIIAVEDMHWIDAASEALAGMVESLEGVPLLLILTYRPGYRLPWSGKSHLTQIALQPLSAEDSLNVLGRLLPPARLSEPVAQLILSKAKGNPFFLEELARAVQEQGGLSPAIRVPETVQEVLLARINRLPDRERRLLQSAAVVGKNVSVDVLRFLAELPEEELGEVFGHLCGADFLYEATTGSEVQYRFRHGLTQEVAYDSLTERCRESLHAAVGTALEGLYAGRANEAAELLAHHFGLSDQADKAVDYALLAAEKAHRRWANTEALAHFAAATRRLDGMPDTDANRLRRIDAIVKQAEVKFALGQHADHVNALESIRDLVKTVADPQRRATWYYWTGFLHSLTGSRPEVAIGHCREASAIADAAGLEEIRAYAECCLAQVLLLAGDLQGALDVGERALAIFESHGNAWWACRTLWQMSPAANALGQWERSLSYCRRALEHGQAVTDLRLKVVALSRIGGTQVQRGDPQGALRSCAEALKLAPAPFDAAMVKSVHGYALVKAGDPIGAKELEESVAWFDRLGNSVGILAEPERFRRYLGAACLGTGTGNYRQAEDLLLKVLQWLEGDRSRERFGLAGFPSVMARAYVTQVFADRGESRKGSPTARKPSASPRRSITPTAWPSRAGASPISRSPGENLATPCV